MLDPELAQLDLLAQIDSLTARIRVWSREECRWRPCDRAHALAQRILDHVDGLRERMTAPLVVALFGGTGTGKSTLVNALVGTPISETGRQRPTTRRPLLIAHQQLDLSTLGFDPGGYEISRFDGPLFREIVLIDCPDPDTSENENPESNLAALRAVVPHCDVLIFTATQQKYRSARVIEELAAAASGCRLLFVQTHADRDADIREDWAAQLSGFTVPAIYFVDSPAALENRLTGRPPQGDFARLVETLHAELDANSRARVRRANILGLLEEALGHCQNLLEEDRPAVRQLELEIEKEQTRLTQEFTRRLTEELLSSRRLWERRILSQVTDDWGMSPFAVLLRLANSLGSALASLTVYRARSAAQVALVGAAEGARRLRAWNEERTAQARPVRTDHLSLSDAELRTSRTVIAGYAATAGLMNRPSEEELERVRAAAANLEQRFLADAGQRIDTVIRETARRNSRLMVRLGYEALFDVFLAIVLWRIMKNFFWDSFLRTVWWSAAEPAPLLPMEFYASAGVLLVLWAALLVIAFIRRLRRGLARRIRRLAESLETHHVSGGLFQAYEADCRWINVHLDDLRRLRIDVAAVCAESPSQGQLGGPRRPDNRTPVVP